MKQDNFTWRDEISVTLQCYDSPQTKVVCVQFKGILQGYILQFVVERCQNFSQTKEDFLKDPISSLVDYILTWKNMFLVEKGLFPYDLVAMET